MAEEIRRETTSGMPGGPPGGYSATYGGPYTGGTYGGGPPYTTATAIEKTPMIKRISWGAIFAGTFVALALSVLLWLLGAAVGLAAFDPGTPVGTVWMWGIGIWGIIVAIISLFCGGMVAAWLAGLPKWMDAMLHGLVVWGLATTAAFGLTGMLGATVAGGVAAMDTQQRAMGPQQDRGLIAMPELRRDDPYETVRNELKRELPSEDAWFDWGDDRRQYSESEINQLVQMVQRGQTDQVVNALVRDAEMHPQLAQRRVQQWQQILQQDRQRLFAMPERDMQRRPGDEPVVTDREAVDAATAAATWAFFALLLGACAAAVGGAIGRPSYKEDRITSGGHPRYTPPGYQHGGQYSGPTYGGYGTHGGPSGEPGRYQPPPSY